MVWFFIVIGRKKENRIFCKTSELNNLLFAFDGTLSNSLSLSVSLSLSLFHFSFILVPFSIRDSFSCFLLSFFTPLFLSQFWRSFFPFTISLLSLPCLGFCFTFCFSQPISVLAYCQLALGRFFCQKGGKKEKFDLVSYSWVRFTDLAAFCTACLERWI